ncbi:MAG: ABC transporter permease [Phycisphaeraceae bacterium]
MTSFRLILQSLRHYWRTHLGVIAGVIVATAVLTGAMVVGDSVRQSLREMALARLGDTHLAMVPHERNYDVSLASRMSEKLDAPVAPVMFLPGTATSDASKERAGRVQVVGIDHRFTSLFLRGMLAAPPGGPSPHTVILEEIPRETVALSRQLADVLKAKIGETVLLRVSKPSLLPRDAPLTRSDVNDISLGLRAKVTHIVDDTAGGRFSLAANQVAPLNAFVSLAWLQQELKLEGRANLMLVGPAKSGEITAAQADASLKETFELSDVGIEVRQVANQPWIELRTDRVFLEQPLLDAARQAGETLGVTPMAVLTYMVNEIRSPGGAVPYSMVSALGPLGKLPSERPSISWPQSVMNLQPTNHGDEIVINDWLAEHLKIRADSLQEERKVWLSYFVQGPGGELVEKTTEQPFRVVRMVPIEGAAADRTLLPQFPDMPSQGTTFSQWKPSFKLKHKIEPRDDAYWQAHGGTPKAFIHYDTGLKLWENRFGPATAVRFPLMEDVAGRPPASVETVRDQIERRIVPASIGLSFIPVRDQALKASREGFDFAQLFLGFSFFLIVAALLLTGLLFVFTIEQRSTQVGTLLAIGFRPKQVRRLLLMEGLVLSVISAVIGVVLGLIYTKGLLVGLRTVWRGAVGTTALNFYVQPMTLVIGFGSSVAVAMLTIWLVLRKQARQPARELLAGGAGSLSKVTPQTQGGGRKAFITGLVLFIGAIALLAWTASTGNLRNAGAFFGSGAMLLTAGLLLSFTLLTRMLIRTGGSSDTGAIKLTISALGLRNNARRRGRSLATIGLLACGAFLVIAIGAFWLVPTDNPTDRKSGTGGFTLYGESTLSILTDLNTEEGLDKFALERDDLPDVKFVPMRVRDGDDASCLNLNRAQNPRLVGVNPKPLAERGAFSDRKDSWDLLQGNFSPLKGSDHSIIPAIGDANTITYGLGKGIGDSLEYIDEAGNTFKVEIIATLNNSILQGSLFIDEAHFKAKYPSVSGHRMFLIDAPSAKLDAVRKTLGDAMGDVGLELTPTVERLAMFNQVQNTYLSIFQALGGLGLLLGSIGLGIVVLRNVLERRGELALLAAVGFSKSRLSWLVLSEHWFLLVAGLLCGLVAAIVAIIPAASSPGSQPPFALLAAIVAGVFLSGLIWTWLACRLALRGPLLVSLRGE